MIVNLETTGHGDPFKNVFKKNELVFICLHDQNGVISILNYRKRNLRILRKRRKKISLLVFQIDDTLKQVSSNSKKQ